MCPVMSVFARFTSTFRRVEKFQVFSQMSNLIPVFQRPRKIGAKYTGSDFAPDEYIQPQLDFDYDGKRDQWNGYDISEHKHISEEFQKLEEVRWKKCYWIQYSY